MQKKKSKPRITKNGHRKRLEPLNRNPILIQPTDQFDRNYERRHKSTSKQVNLITTSSYDMILPNAAGPANRKSNEYLLP